jgi:transposase
MSAPAVSDEVARAIYLAPGSRKQLARRFDVPTSTVANIKNRINYRGALAFALPINAALTVAAFTGEI